MKNAIYETGARGVKRNNQLADELFQNSFQRGYVPARIRLLIPYKKSINDELCEKELPRVYINAHFVGINREEGYKLAIHYFEKAPAPLGLYGLAIRFKNGDGVEKNLQTAFELFVASATLGYCDASNKVAIAYNNGYGIDQNPTRAFHYYKKAYEQGSHEALNDYGWCLTNNYGTENDYDLAYKIFMESAELGLSTPTSNVGWCY